LISHPENQNVCFFSFYFISSFFFSLNILPLLAYELRVVIYNTVEVDMKDVSFAGEEMSDIYIKGMSISFFFPSTFIPNLLFIIKNNNNHFT